MLTDIEIAHRAKLKPIEEIAEKIGIDSDSGYRHFSYPGR